MKQGKPSPGQVPARAVAYYRQSTPDSEPNPISLQREQIREFADRHGIEIIHEVSDPGTPGTGPIVPLHGLMREVAQRDDFQYVLCLDESRFLRFRDLKLLAYCRKHGKQLIFTATADDCPRRPA